MSTVVYRAIPSIEQIAKPGYAVRVIAMVTDGTRTVEAIATLCEASFISKGAYRISARANRPGTVRGAMGAHQKALAAEGMAAARGMLLALVRAQGWQEQDSPVWSTYYKAAGI